MIKKSLIINGVQRFLLVDEKETLASVLRERLLLTGCKIGCGEGHCGACNVIMDGKVTRSCIVKMGKVRDNAEITTIEGIGTISDMHPLQAVLRSEFFWRGQWPHCSLSHTDRHRRRCRNGGFSPIRYRFQGQ